MDTRSRRLASIHPWEKWLPRLPIQFEALSKLSFWLLCLLHVSDPRLSFLDKRWLEKWSRHTTTCIRKDVQSRLTVKDLSEFMQKKLHTALGNFFYINSVRFFTISLGSLIFHYFNPNHLLIARKVREVRIELTHVGSPSLLENQKQKFSPVLIFCRNKLRWCVLKNGT